MNTKTALVPPDASRIRANVRRALEEDLGPGDVNVDFLPAAARADARVICREAIVLAGAPWFDACFAELAPSTSIRWHYADGDRVPANAELCRMTGSARALLSGERTALNFLQTLSATATTTARYVDAVAGTSTTILDTRKTLPGLRFAQKYAVRCGGGSNHRMGLFDQFLIKENHITVAGGVIPAVTEARQSRPDLPLVVEVENLDELRQAISAGADRALLDEFDEADIATAVRLADGKLLLEVSGSVTLDRLAQLARLGVDFISVGALTKNIRAIDLSMRIVHQTVPQPDAV